MLSTGAQKDTQRVEKHEAFVLVQWFGQAEINRGETTRTPLHFSVLCAEAAAAGTCRERAKCPSPYLLSGQLSL